MVAVDMAQEAFQRRTAAGGLAEVVDCRIKQVSKGLKGGGKEVKPTADVGELSDDAIEG